jgi:hypothetical protein
MSGTLSPISGDLKLDMRVSPVAVRRGAPGTLARRADACAC